MCRKEPSILGRFFNRLGVPLKLSAQDMVPTAAKLGSAATMSSFRGTALKQLGTQVLAQHARYEAALAVVCKTGATYQKRAALQVLITRACSEAMQTADALLQSHMHLLAAAAKVLPGVAASCTFSLNLLQDPQLCH